MMDVGGLILLQFFLGSIPSVTAECTRQPVDFMFALAASGRITPAEKEDQLSFIMTILGKLDVSDTGTHVSMASISVVPQFHFRFDQYTDIKSLENAIRNHSETMDLADIGSTLELIKKEGFDPVANGGRPNAVHVVVIFTKGKSVLPNVTKQYADELREEPSVTIFAIGETCCESSAGEVELSAIATNTTYQFEVGSFNFLITIINDVSRLINALRRVVCTSPQICPSGWLYHNCTCYFQTKEATPLREGWHICKKLHSRVALVEDFNTYSFLQGNFPDSRIAIHIVDNPKAKFVAEISSLVDEKGCFLRKYNENTSQTIEKNTELLHTVCSYPVESCKARSELSICPTTLSSDVISTTTSSKRASTPTDSQRHNGIHLDSVALQVNIMKIKQNLTIDKKRLSRFERRLISAKDERVSSKDMGIVSGVILCIFPMFCVFSDCFNICTRKRRRRTVFVSN